MRRIDNAPLAFRLVYLCKLFRDFDRLDRLNTRYLLDEDMVWTALYEALGEVCDAAWTEYSDDSGEEKFYFSDAAMMEYYRLCRVYCMRMGVILNDNPYIKSASEYVHSMLNNTDGNFGYHLQTKINHDWASGIIVVYWPEYFYEHFELIETLLYIFDFYKAELEKLKADLFIEDGANIQTKEAA